MTTEVRDSVGITPEAVPAEPETSSPATDTELARALSRAADPALTVESDDDEDWVPRRVAASWRARSAKRMARWWYRRLRKRPARRWITRLGWDQPLTVSTFTTTNQAAPLDPLLTKTRLQDYGDLYGTDLLTFQPIAGSVQKLYDRKVLTAPMVAVLGAIGTRKSTLAKTLYALRPNCTGTQVAVFDRKQQRDDGTLAGEYTRLAATVPNSVVLTLHRDRARGTRINVLDPAIASTGTEDRVGQDELLRLVAVTALGRQLTAEEGYALQAAHRAALSEAQDAGRVAILSDVVRHLYAPDTSAVPGPRDEQGIPVLTARHIVDHARVTEWGLPVALAFERFLSGDLSGIIDGPTEGPDGRPLNLDAPLLVIDTSALTEGSAALGLMMVIMSTYLMSRWAAMPGFKHLILEEAYSADDLDDVGETLRALVKRSRGVGAAVIAVMHHISDVRETSPLYALIKEAGVVHVFQQDKHEDAEAVVRMFDLPPDMVSTIQTLPPGVNVWKRGRLVPTLAIGFRTSLEAWVTDTDEAMRFEAEEADHA